MGTVHAARVVVSWAIIACAGACAGLVVGCGVSKSTHQAVVEELDDCEADRDTYAAKRSDLAKQVEELGTQLEEERAATAEKLEASQEELEAMREQQAALDRQLEEFQSLTDRFQEMIAADGIQVYVRRGRMIVALPSSVLFASGQADLSPRGTRTLERVAGKLKDFRDRRFIVAGHTDNVPIGSVDFEDNWHLSTARALMVTRFLIGQGLNPRNLAAAGYGEHDPVRSNKTKAGRRRNRRIELILEPRIPDFTKVARLSRKAGKAAKPGEKRGKGTGKERGNKRGNKRGGKKPGGAPAR